MNQSALKNQSSYYMLLEFYQNYILKNNSLVALFDLQSASGWFVHYSTLPRTFQAMSWLGHPRKEYQLRLMGDCCRWGYFHLRRLSVYADIRNNTTFLHFMCNYKRTPRAFSPQKTKCCSPNVFTLPLPLGFLLLDVLVLISIHYNKVCYKFCIKHCTVMEVKEKKWFRWLTYIETTQNLRGLDNQSNTRRNVTFKIHTLIKHTHLFTNTVTHANISPIFSRL